MKNIYIKPEVEFEQLEAHNVMATSWGTDPNDFTDDPNQKDPNDPNGTLVGGSGFGDAKGGFTYWEDDFEEESF